VWTLTILQLVKSIKQLLKLSAVPGNVSHFDFKKAAIQKMLARGISKMLWRGMIFMATSAALVDSLVHQPQRSAPVRSADLLIKSSHRHLPTTFLPLRGGAPTIGKNEIKKGVS